jgi:hypothetical protein
MELPRILLFTTRHAHHPPDALIALLMPREEIQQPSQIEAIRLRAPRAPIHLDARRIDDVIRDGVGHQSPVQPKGLATGLVTAHDRRIGRQPEATLRAGDLLHDPIRRTSRNLLHARSLPKPHGEPEFPRAFTQLEGQQQHRRRC